MSKITPYNIDRYLEGTKCRVDYVGVELEGAWKLTAMPDKNIQRDSSVFNDKAPNGYAIGELPIGKVKPSAIGKLMRKYYPAMVNDTCGMHVHMSFNTLWYYGLLMVPEFQETMAEYLTRWAKQERFPESHYIYRRLAGEVEYCKKEFDPDSQATTKRKDYDHFRPGNRYTIVHYCGRFNTIECRVLPMMQDVEQAIRGVHEVIRITNACLRLKGKGREPKFSGRFVLPGGAMVEEHIEEI